MSYLIQGFQWLHTTLIHNPLYSLYFKGPENIGFWGGAAREDICFSLTTSPSSFWQENPIQCNILCEQRFEAFITLINFIIYSVIMVRLVNGIVFHLCFTRPVLKELRQSRVAHSVDNDTRYPGRNQGCRHPPCGTVTRRVADNHQDSRHDRKLYRKFHRVGRLG